MPAFKCPPCVTIDFETYEIRGRPQYPPEPVGVSIQWPRQKPLYYGWGHVANDNNAPRHVAEKLLHDVWESQYPILAHNAKFDIDVAEVHFHLPRQRWDRYHDTLPILFLDDPRAHTFQLKPAAENYLQQPPEERDAVRDWLIEHQPVPGVRITKSTFGKYIAYCPCTVVEPYANGDTQRTTDLFALLYPVICNRGMKDAYDRERRLLPVLLDMERTGVPVNLDKLEADTFAYQTCMARLDVWLRKKLKVGDDLNLSSGDQLAAALIDARLADADLLGVTRTGKFQTTQDAMARAVTDMQVRNALIYRAQLGTALHTFMEPWLEVALATGGLIHTTWNSVRTPSGQKSVGTRTGRLSSTPNFQNIPNKYDPLFQGKGLPKAPIKDLLPLPYMRSYIVPYDGHVLIGRDFSQQELRILAHYAEGSLLETYNQNPWTDFHDYARDMINQMLQSSYERKPIKNLGFGLIYGMGLGKLAISIEDSIDVARKLKAAYLYQFPGVKQLYDEMRRRAKFDEPIRTWGGREYYVETPEIVNGQVRTYDYKLVNLLIQGSAGDCTKNAMLEYHEELPDEWFMFLTVHDELLTSVPIDDLHHGMEHLRHAMESPQFDLPMLSEGYYSYENWFDLQPYDKAGEVVYKEK